MFELLDGRASAFQWDTGLYVDCTGLAESDEVHFCRPGITLALHPAMQGETLVARVPDELLQQAQPIIIFAYVQTATGEITKVSTRLCVTARPKPPGYISTPTEALRWENLQEQIGDLNGLNTQDKTNLVAAVNEAMTQGGGADPASVQQIVEDYLAKNPPAAGADGKSAYQYAVEGGYTGTEAEFVAKLAEEMPDKLPNPNALTFTGAVTGTYDGSAPLTVNIPEGGGVTDEQVETAVNAWLDENGDAALTGGGWRKIATHVWDGNTEYQPLTLDYATGEMTFAEAPSTVNCVWPVPNNMNDVSAATELDVFYSKIPKEFLTVGAMGSFSTGTNGYKFGNVSSMEEGGVNANVDISAFRFEKCGTAPSFTGLNAKRVKVRMLCPGGNFWINNGSFSFKAKLSNGQLVNLGEGIGVATARVAYGIIDQDISVGWNILSQQYSVVIEQCKARTNQNQYFEYRNYDFTYKNRIIPDGVTITDLIFNGGNGNYWPCNGTVVEVYEFVG